MRNQIVLYLNGVRHELGENEAFMTVSDFLRYQKSLTGTKVVCAEGDCGACTILVSRMVGEKLTPYKSINSCISFMYLVDLCHLITVEGLKKDQTFHPVQKAMVDCNGAQCGYCTPGFICAMASLTEDAKIEKFPLDEKRVKNYLTGNLCRCTGYESIITAGCSVDLKTVPLLTSFYDDALIEKDLSRFAHQSVSLKKDEHEIYLPATVKEAVSLRAKMPTLKMKSGATDLGVLHNKGKIKLTQVMALTHVPELYEIHEDATAFTVGARASLEQVEKAFAKEFSAFSNYLHVFASPQIKNSGTLVGNVINASPIADTIPFLKVAEANIVLEGPAGIRTLNLNSFFMGGYKQIDLKPDEIVTHIQIPKTKDTFKLYKVSTRRDLDISTVTVAARFEISEGKFKKLSLAFGGVGPTVLRMTQIEQAAINQPISKALFQTLAKNLTPLIAPLSDVRGTSDYRRLLCHNLILKLGDEVMQELGMAPAEASL